MSGFAWMVVACVFLIGFMFLCLGLESLMEKRRIAHEESNPATGRNGEDEVTYSLHDLSVIGRNIRERRTWLGMTREQLAERCDLSVQTIYRVEQGMTREPGIATLSRICNALGCSLDVLVKPDSSPGGRKGGDNHAMD